MPATGKVVKPGPYVVPLTVIVVAPVGMPVIIMAVTAPGAGSLLAVVLV